MIDIQWIPIVSSVLLLLAVALGLGPLGRVWDMISRRYTRDLLDLLAILEIDESKFNAWMRLWGFVLAATIFLMLFVCRMPLLAIAVSIIIIALPRIWMGILVKRRRTLLREQMAGACIAIANCARAGLSLDQALQTVADESANPLAGVLRRICRDELRQAAQVVRDLRRTELANRSYSLPPVTEIASESDFLKRQ